MLLLCIAAVVLWGRSRWAEDEIFLRRYSGAAPSGTPGGGLIYQYQSLGICWPRDMLAFFWFAQVPTDFDESLRDRQRNPRGIRLTIVHKPANDRLARTLVAPDRSYLHFIHVMSVQSPGIGRRVYVGVPFWGAVVALTVLPVTWVVMRIRAGRGRVGYCGGCGYDLRATPDRCPECGHVPATQAH